MKVTCPNCSKTLNIPDEKIPEQKTLTFNCPRCKGPVSVSRDAKAETGGVLPDLGEIPEKTPIPAPLDETHDVPVPPPRADAIPAMSDAVGAIEDEMDVLGEGKYRALVADNDNIDRIRPVMKKMQYVVTQARSHEEAIQKMTFNSYDLVIINEHFEGTEPANNTLHKHIEAMTMDVRRKMFVVMTGKNFKTLDNMTAFNRSVNMVMNEGDFVNFELILKKAMKENEVFYHILNQMLIETGKEIAL